MGSSNEMRCYIVMPPRIDLAHTLNDPWVAVGWGNGLILICSAPSHYLNKCWHIVKWTLGNELLWNLNKMITKSKLIFKCRMWHIMKFVIVLEQNIPMMGQWSTKDPFPEGSLAQNPNLVKFMLLLPEAWCYHLNLETVLHMPRQVVTYTDLWLDWIIRTTVTMKRVLTRFRLWARKPFVKWIPVYVHDMEVWSACKPA